jgi:hypothetical protein
MYAFGGCASCDGSLTGVYELCRFRLGSEIRELSRTCIEGVIGIGSLSSRFSKILISLSMVAFGTPDNAAVGILKDLWGP